jgi:ribonucleoside-diphosphate reductase alpha chain
MKRVREGGEWTLFSPSDVPDLHDRYGPAFERRYVEYERMADAGEIRLFKRLPAVDLWRKMLTRLFETGHPWITWKDPANIRSPQDHAGVIHSSNLCTEILLNTSVEETAVCNLGSINLPAHLVDGRLDLARLEQTVRTAVRMLDNVIDINYYPTPEARTANLRHRPIGLGLMGFQDALYELGISYASHAAVEFADRSMEAIAYFALLASSDLARERGPYPSYPGSKWDRGLLPLDTIDLLEAARGLPVEMDRSATLDWERVRAAIRQHGMRNSNVLAIAPTATISTIVGVSQSIEPTYKNLYVKSNLSGDFVQINRYLVRDLKRAGLWDAGMLDDLKYYDGSLQEIARVPEALKQRYLTAFEIAPEWLIECASRRQKWIDMGQSLNLYLAEPSGRALHEMYFLAWNKGLKTTYYLRTLAATQIEKSTLDINRRGIQPRWMRSRSPSSAIRVERASPSGAPDAPACSLDAACEACQ